MGNFRTFFKKDTTVSPGSDVSGQTGGHNIGGIVVGHNDGHITVNQGAATCASDQDEFIRMVEDTQAVFRTTSVFDSVKQHVKSGNLLVITGGPGDGKTSIALMIAQEHGRKGYNVSFLKSLDKLSVKIQSKKTTIILDDVLSPNKIKNSLPVGLQIIHDLVDDGEKKDVFIVITCNKYDWEKTKYEYKNCTTLQKAVVVDLAVQGYTQEDKNIIFQEYQVSFAEKNEFLQENLDPVGYPRLCANLKNHRGKGMSNMLHTHYRVQMQNILEDSLIRSALFVMMLLCNGCLTLSEFQSFAIQRRLETLKSILPDMRLELIYQEAQFFTGLYLIKESDLVSFLHPIIRDACIFAVDNMFPGFLWKHFTIMFDSDEIEDKSPPQKDASLTLRISGTNAHAMLERLIEYIRESKFAEAFTHPILQDTSKVDFLLERCSNDISYILKEHDMRACTLLYWVFFCPNEHMCFKILDIPEVKPPIIHEALMLSVKSKHKRSFDILKKKPFAYDLEYCDSDGESFLIAASRKGDYEMVRFLLEQGAHIADVSFCFPLLVSSTTEDIRACSCPCRSPLHIATIQGNTRVVEQFFQLWNPQPASIRSMLFWACVKGREEVANFLLTKEDCKDTVDESGNTPLIWACAAGAEDIVEVLLKRNADVTLQNSAGDTALIVACSKGLSKVANLVLVHQRIQNVNESKFDENTTLFATREGDLDAFFATKTMSNLDVNKVNNNGDSSIVVACRKGYEHIANMLLACKANVNASDNSGNTAVILAAQSGNVTIVNSLLKHNPDVLLLNRDNITVCNISCQMGRLDIVQSIIEYNRRAANAQTECAITPLMSACLGGNEDIVEFLLKNGAAVNAKNSNGDTALVWAVMGGNSRLVKMLLLWEADVQILNKNEESAISLSYKHEAVALEFLNWACSENNDGVVKTILEEGNIDANIRYGDDTLLMISCKSGSYSIVQLILSHGADANLTDRDGNTALILAVRQGVNATDGNENIVEQLLRTEAVVNVTNSNGDTALIWAVMRGNSKIVNKLLICHADVEILNKNEESAILLSYTHEAVVLEFLNWACSENNDGVVKTILEEGNIDCNIRYGDDTLLMISCKSGSYSVVQVLLSHGADANLTDRDGNTTLILAFKREFKDIIKFILKWTLNENMESKDEKTDMHTACLKGNVEFVKCLLSNMTDFDDVPRQNIDQFLTKRDTNNNMALHIACQRGYIDLVRMLLPSMHNEKDLPGKNMRTCIMIAALNGDKELYHYLADVEDCETTGVDDSGNTILHLACMGGDACIVSYIIHESKTTVFSRNHDGQTPAEVASANGNKHLLALFVPWAHNLLPQYCRVAKSIALCNGGTCQNIPVCLQSREQGMPLRHREDLETYVGKKLIHVVLVDEDGVTLLHNAVFNDYSDLARYLLSEGNMDINIRDGFGRTPVVLAAEKGNLLMFNFLVDREVDLTVKDKNRNTLLHFACRGMNIEIINKIMEHGFTDVNSRNNAMKTPLSYAVEAGDKQIFNTVLNRGGDLLVVDIDKNTLLHLACKGGNLAIVEHLLSLIMFGIDAVNREQRTPLLVAAYSGHTDVCHHLICVGADLHIQDLDGNDVLLVAADQGMEDLTKYILMNSFVNNKDNSGETAPMKAAKKGHHEVFRVIMDDRPFDSSTRDNLGNNILHIACIGGNVDIVKYILSHNKVYIQSRNRLGRTPVKLAEVNGHTAVVDFLRHHGGHD